jgi:hypothetical protein
MTTSSMIHADKELAQYCIDRLLAAGADKSQCVLTLSEKSGVQRRQRRHQPPAHDAQRGRLSDGARRRAQGLAGHQPARARSPRCGGQGSRRARAQLAAGRSQRHRRGGGTEELRVGGSRAGSRADARTAQSLPRLRQGALSAHRTGEVQLDFTTSSQQFSNSNGVDFAEREGLYSFSTFFTSREGTHSSSFNYTGFKRRGARYRAL